MLGLLAWSKLRSDDSSGDSDSDSDEEAGDRHVSLREPSKAALINVKSKSTLMDGFESPLMVGDMCEVRSVSQNKWLVAKVTMVNDSSRTVTVEYDSKSGRMKKELPYQSDHLRKLEGTPVRDDPLAIFEARNHTLTGCSARKPGAVIISEYVCGRLQLPKGWARETDHKGKTYYTNRTTGTPQKHPPHQRSALRK